MDPPRPTPGAIDWNWRFAGFGAVMSIVAVLTVLAGEVLYGTFLLIGSIPAAILGLAPTRKGRRAVLVVGILFGVSILLGSVLAVWVPLAIAGMFMVSVLAARLAVKQPLGVLALSVILPLTAIGLTYTGLGESAKIAGVIVLGSVGSFIWAMILPEYDGEVAPQPQMDPTEATQYGVVLGLAAATATAVGFALDVEFVGWLVGSTVLVMRPDMHTLNLRGIGRVISVIIGGIAAALLLLADPPAGVIAVVLWLVLVVMAATSHSTYYVTPAFTSFLILWALLYGRAELDDVEADLSERIVDTVIGVAIAYAVGAGLLAILSKRREARPS